MCVVKTLMVIGRNHSNNANSMLSIPVDLNRCPLRSVSRYNKKPDFCKILVSFQFDLSAVFEMDDNFPKLFYLPYLLL